MKNNLLILLFFPSFIYAQTAFVNKGGTVYIQKGGLLSIQGDFLNNGTSSGILNDGTIELAGNFDNATGGTFQVYNNPDSKERVVKFIGSGTQVIKGSMSTTGSSSFYNMVIDQASATDTVEMQTPVAIEGSLVFGTANITTSYNPSNLYTNNNQKGLFKTFNDTLGEFLLDVQNGSSDAISGYPSLEIGGAPTTGYVLTKGTRGSSDGGLQRAISSATSYIWPIGTPDKGFNGVRLNFSQVPGNGSVKAKFCSGSSNPDGRVGMISQECVGCTAAAPDPTNTGYNRFFTSDECNAGSPQWVIFQSTVKNHGYWSFASTNKGYHYDMEVFPNSVSEIDPSSTWRVIKHEADFGADPSLATVDWRPEIDSLVASTGDILTYTKNTGCYTGSGVPGGSYTDFSHFTLGGSPGGTELPVKLLYVNAEPEGKHHVNVTWATAVEVNNAGFFVMRSADGVNFTEAGWVVGHDNSTVTQNYSFDDRPPLSSNVYYYKLKQVDNNQHFTYSNIVQVTLTDQEATFTLFPNPSSGQVFLTVKDPSEEVKVTIFDMKGQPVYNNIFTIEQTGSSQTLAISASSLMPMGTYVLNANTNGQTFNAKMILQ